MQKSFTFLTALVCMVCTQLLAQSSITGTVKDLSGNIVAATTISLLTATDSSWLRSELTEENGTFAFNDITEGKYILAITALGYLDKKEAISITKTPFSINIVLDKKTTELKEVTVTANKPFIERELGKTIVNVTAEKAQGSNVLDLMRKLPGLTVTGNGSISMSGKQGVLVMVDGKKTYLSGDELANYLRSMTAEQVAQLEIISQPSAKYEAEGNTGIINIKTRKNQKEGLNGTASASYAQSAFPGTSESLRIGYKKDKTSLSANAGYYNHKGFLNETVDRKFKDKTTNQVTGQMQQSSYLEEHFKDYSLGMDAEQEINDKTSVNLHVHGIYHPNNEVDKTKTSIHDLATNTTTYSNYMNDRYFLRQVFNSVLQVNKKFNKDHELIANADYISYNINNTQDMVNDNYNAQMQPIPGGIYLKGILPTNTKVYSVKADYSGTLGKQTKIEAGAAASFVSINAGVFFDVNDNGVWEKDTMRSNNLLYNENINAAYISCGKPFSEKLEAKIGIRAEQTNAIGIQEVGNSRFDRYYLSLFPTAFIAYKPNEDYNFQCNYGRRIQRPEYRQMNPYIEFLSQYSYRTGNPKLLPQYSHNLELTTSYKNVLTANMTYSSVSDIINDISKQNNTTYSYYVIPENIARFACAQFALTFNKELYKWWEFSSTGYAFASDYEGIYDNKPFKGKGRGYGINMSSDFKFLDNWKAGYWLAANGRSTESSMVTTSPNLYIGLSCSKRLFHDTTLVKIDIQDPFHTYVYNATTTMYDVDSQVKDQYNTMSYTVSVSYDFGKQLDRMRRISGTSDGAGRMKM